VKVYWMALAIVFLLPLAGGVMANTDNLEPSDRSRIVFFVH